MDPHLTRHDLNSILERARKSTPGPWCVAGSPRDFVIAKHGGSERCSDNPVLWAEDDCLAGKPSDADFIAQARSDVPRLVEEIDRLHKLLTRVMVWQLGTARATDIRGACPDPGLADEVVEVLGEADSG